MKSLWLPMIGDASSMQETEGEGDAVPVAAAGGSVGDMAWSSMFHQLLQFKAAHGHCFVPLRCRENPQLGAWLAEQVEHFQGQRLPAERQRALEELGFAWDFAETRGKNPGHDLRWEQRFAEMAAFKEQHGHLRITLTNQSSPGFMHWRDNQRINFRAGKLRPDRKARLDALGLEWESPDRIAVHAEEHNAALWERMFAQLLLFKEAHGHCQVPTSWKENPTLAKWVIRQRGHNNHGRLLNERKARLDQIGFAWKSGGNRNPLGWDARFAEMAAFKEMHGHLHITKSNQLSAGLYHWLDNQRINLRAGRLIPERKARLDALCPAWERNIPQPRVPRPPRVPPQLAYDRAWEARLAQLAAFHAAHGHCRPSRRDAQTRSLAGWVRDQRRALRDGRLSAERGAKLDALDWLRARPVTARAPGEHTSTANDRAWEARLAQLAAFHAAHGHCRPSRRDAQTRSLAGWVRDQRRALRDGRLSAERGAKLDALDWLRARPVTAGSADERFIHQRALGDERLRELTAFLSTHGHMRVPKGRPEYKRLFSWVVTQRVYHRKGTLRPERKEQLDALGFDWNPGTTGKGHKLDSAWITEQWERRFQQLLDFKEHHGHLHVPKHKKEYMSLGNWVAMHRHQHRRGTLSQERARRLDEIGFVWNPSADPHRRGGSRESASERWEARFAQLLAFQAEHGHVNVPTKYPPDKQLGNWVSNTRISRRLGQLSAGRIERLDALGFIWVKGRSAGVNRGYWNLRYAELLDFKAQHGHPNVPSTYAANRSLAAWVATQRLRQRRGRLSEEQKARLDALGLQWYAQRIAPKNRSWDQRLADLTRYKERYGHPHISQGDIGFQRLRTWALAQRVAYNRGQLPPDKIDKLNAIGFAWDGVEGVWERTLLQWRAVVRSYTPRHIPLSDREHHALAQWEARQRQLHDKGQLSPAHRSRLIDASFPWDVPPDMPEPALPRSRRRQKKPGHATRQPPPKE